MKKSIFQFYEEISPSSFIHYNSVTNTFLLLNLDCHKAYIQSDNVDTLKSGNFELYNRLVGVSPTFRTKVTLM